MSRIRNKFQKKLALGKPSFVSYVDKQNDLPVDDDISMLVEDFSSLADDMFEQLNPSYLPGEVLVSRADRVVQYVPYSDYHQGVVGSLFVTQFRILFISVQSKDGATQNPFWRNKLYGENDIILNNIRGVYQVSKGKQKKLAVGKQTAKQINKIEIHCKDFRLHQFGFENVKTQETSVQVINAITHFAFPDRLDRLFAFSYKGNTKPANTLPDFSIRDSWEAELKRLAASKMFRVVDNNDSFQESPFMPRYFVVPAAVTNQALKSDIICYEEYSVPVWCYTYRNGASLIRMTFPVSSCPDKEAVDYEFAQRLKQIHPEKKMPVIFDVHQSNPTLIGPTKDDFKLPSVKEIQQSHKKLRKLCMPVTMKALESSDASWYRNLDSTNWLVHVLSCLKVAVFLARIIMGDLPQELKPMRRTNVAIKEHDGARDMAAILTSLIQLLLDPYYRSIKGFQLLIEKEWVALGHRFRDRLGLITGPDGDEKQSPVFLLFLDCVYQLQRLMPRSFEFSEHYLTLLWDNARSGLFENFIFNCQHDSIFESDHTKRFSERRKKCLLNVWDISKQFSDSDFSLYKNPSYCQWLKTKVKLSAQESLDYYMCTGSEDRMKQSVKILDKYTYYSQKPTERVIQLTLEEQARSVKQDVLPEVLREINGDQISFWTGCYLRWLTPIQIVSGGQPMEFVLESILAERTCMLLKQIEQLERTSVQTGAHPEPEPFWSTQGNQLMNVTSSFPFLPERPRSQVYFFMTPMKINSEEMTSSAEFHSSVSSASTDCRSSFL